MAAAPEDLRSGGILFGGRNEDDEEEDDTPAVRCAHSPTESTDFSRKRNAHVFM